MCLGGRSQVDEWLRWLGVPFWAARRSQTSRGFPTHWILPYLSALSLRPLTLFVGFGFGGGCAAGWSPVWAGLESLFGVSLSGVVVSGVEGGEVALDGFSVSGELGGVVCGESVIPDFASSLEDLKNLGIGSADAGGELRKAGPAYGRWVGSPL